MGDEPAKCSRCGDPCMIVDRDLEPERRLCAPCWTRSMRIADSCAPDCTHMTGGEHTPACKAK